MRVSVFHTITECSCFYRYPSWSPSGLVWYWCSLKLLMFSRKTPRLTVVLDKHWIPEAAFLFITIIHNLSIIFIKFILLQYLLDLFSTFTSYSVSHHQNVHSEKNFCITFGYEKLCENSNVCWILKSPGHFSSLWQEWDRLFGIWNIPGNLRTVSSNMFFPTFSPCALIFH